MTRFEREELALGAELDRLASAAESTEAEIGAIQAKLQSDEDVDEDLLRAQLARKRGHLADLEHMGLAVGELVSDHGEDESVTVRGLNSGEYAKVKNRTNDAANRSSYDTAPGSGELVYAAAGLIDAPTFDGDADNMDAKLEWLSRQSIGVRKWLQDLVDNRTVVGEKNWRELAGRSSAATPAR